MNSLTSLQPVIGKRFFPNGLFSAFFNDFEFFNGPFLIILHRLLWAIFQVNGTMAHGPLPSQSLYNMYNVNRRTSEGRRKLAFAPTAVITDATIISPQKEFCCLYKIC